MLQMTAMELSAHLHRENASPTILDVREPWEFRIAHLDNSINIPVSEIHARMNELDAQKETIVVCHHGVRSLAVARLLVQNSFDRVINLSGGLDAWAKDVDPSMPTY